MNFELLQKLLGIFLLALHCLLQILELVLTSEMLLQLLWKPLAQKRLMQLLMQQHVPGIRQEREWQEPQQAYPQPQQQLHCSAQYLQQIDLAVSRWLVQAGCLGSDGPGRCRVGG